MRHVWLDLLRRALVKCRYPDLENPLAIGAGHSLFMTLLWRQPAGARG